MGKEQTKIRVQELIENYQMTEHPEGGWYKEVYRSIDKIGVENGERSLLTSIYFLLTSDNISHLHSIKSDELWYFHEGSPLTVHTIDHEGNYFGERLGIDFTVGQNAQLAVEEGTIFGSSVDDDDAYAFVSCAVAPGFDFEDFKLYTTSELLAEYPTHEKVIRRMTKEIYGS